MREKVLKFGPTRGLVGVLTEPPPEAPTGRPQVVFLNSGILHHTGASRLYVRMARRLAALGHPSFRFDFSGIGDSEARRDTLGASESAVVETREAMDLLAARKGGVDRFVLIGLCSGADMGFKVAQVDDRVVGLVQLDPFAYRTRGYWVRHYGPKLLSPAAWRGMVERRLSRWRPAPRPVESAGGTERLEYVAPEYRRRFPPRETVAEALKGLVGRGVRLLNIFSDGQSDHINHGEQYARAFPEVTFRDRLEVAYIRHAAHTFTELEDQKRVLTVVEDWAARLEPSVPLPAAAADGAEAPALR